MVVGSGGGIRELDAVPLKTKASLLLLKVDALPWDFNSTNDPKSGLRGSHNVEYLR